jgi:ABC-type phosphate transport system substrate-binding protein
MKTSFSKFLTIVLCAILLISLGSSTLSQSAGDIVVIINAENPVSALTVSQVKLTYLRKINRRWKEINKNILPVDRKTESDLRKSFLKDVLQMSADELSRYYTEREYQNAEAPPVKLSSDAEVIAYVESNIGAIAYVNKNAIQNNAKVKVVFGP